MSVLEYGFLVFIALAVVTIIYKVLPFKKLKPKKPYLVWFPKYTANYSSSHELLGFKDISKQRTLYSRGSVFGDFLMK